MAKVVVADRCYIEYRTNGVIVETTLFEDEIRYTVLRYGKVLFNKSLEGKYSFPRALMLAREQEHVAKAAEKADA